MSTDADLNSFHGSASDYIEALSSFHKLRSAGDLTSGESNGVMMDGHAEWVNPVDTENRFGADGYSNWTQSSTGQTRRVNASMMWTNDKLDVLRN